LHRPETVQLLECNKDYCTSLQRIGAIILIALQRLGAIILIALQRLGAIILIALQRQGL
jgi:hypothetical protein